MLSGPFQRKRPVYSPENARELQGVSVANHWHGSNLLEIELNIRLIGAIVSHRDMDMRFSQGYCPVWNRTTASAV